MSNIFKYGCGLEDNPLLLMDRVESVDGVLITQASIQSIAYRSFEYANKDDAESDADGIEIGTSTSLTVADTVFDELQTAKPWDISEEAYGFNFRLSLPGTARPTGRKWHRIEVTFTPAGSGAFDIVWIIETIAKAGG